MANGPKLGMSQNLALRQEMVMTPQMIQSMELLQLPIMALEQRISDELLDNPALELSELEDEETSDSAQAREDEKSVDSDEDADFTTDEGLENASLAEDEMDYRLDDDYDEPLPRMSRSWDDDDDKFDAIYNTAGRSASLQDTLVAQLGLLDISEAERELAERIIFSLDDDGYLHTPLEEVPDPHHKPVPTFEQLEDALNVVQSLDPAGVGARNLKECLMLQVRRMGTHFDFECEMIDKHLEDLAANRLPKVAKSMNCTLDEVKGMIDFLKNLNPRPGLDFGPQESLAVVPDVSIRYEEGEFVIKLNRGTLPELRISDDCQDAVKAESSSETRRYLREKIMNAEWIIRAIEQRNRTLLNVTREIVMHQRTFFMGQIERPGPLMMQTVADAVGIDISTVSRAVKEKYADTPRGLICLRDMFTRSVGGDGIVSTTSNDQIMNRLQHLIEREDPKNPLKDGQLVNLLRAEGIRIVRRTVAKYRQNLGIPSHSQRRQY